MSSEAHTNVEKLNPHELLEEIPRRSFLYRGFTALVGFVIITIPAAAGSLFFFGPLLRKKAGAEENFSPPLTNLEALRRNNGKPELYTIYADKVDAWNRTPNQPIGSVYLQLVKAEDGQEKVRAFNATCPHLGCSVEYAEKTADFEKPVFWCPCHKSAFDIDGAKLNPIPPRALDELETKVDEDGKVHVKYEKFLANTPEKIALG